MKELNKAWKSRDGIVFETHDRCLKHENTLVRRILLQQVNKKVKDLNIFKEYKLTNINFTHDEGMGTEPVLSIKIAVQDKVFMINIKEFIELADTIEKYLLALKVLNK